MDDWQTVFSDEWDAIVLGTGMKECLLSGLLSVAGKKVLHLDRNGYYGAESASLDVKQLYDKFGRTEEPSADKLGKLRDYAIDMAPKFIMAGGKLVRVLIHTGVAKYMEFLPVEGSYVYRKDKAHKVPITPKQALSSSMLSAAEKYKMVQFTAWVAKVIPDKDSATWKAGLMKTRLALDTMTGAEFFKYWQFSPSLIEFVTHVTALYTNDSWQTAKALEIVTRMQLYLESMTRFPGMTSPYLYPLYGLGELPQAFARLAAVYGGTYMLNRDVDGTPIFGPGDLRAQYGEDGKCEGVRVGELLGRAKVVVGDPSYFPEKCRTVRKVVRAIAILGKPPVGCEAFPSCQVIIPASQAARQNDLYLFCCTSTHKVAPAGKYVAFLSTYVEGDVGGASPSEIGLQQLEKGLGLFSEPLEVFYDVYDERAPIGAAELDATGVFISKSYDPTSHFETAIDDVLDLYKRITGSELELKDGADEAGPSE